MKEKTINGLSRRNFPGMSALGLTGMTILPSWTMSGVRITPCERVVLGFIGLSQQAMSDFSGFASVPDVQVGSQQRSSKEFSKSH